MADLGARMGPPPRLFHIKTNKAISRATEMARMILVVLLIRIFQRLFVYYFFRLGITV